MGNHRSMFRIWTKNKVSDDAARLKTLTDAVIDNYAEMNIRGAKSAIKGDFEEELRSVDHHDCCFQYRDFPEIQFALWKGAGEKLIVQAMGRGKYAGFFLTVGGGDNWHAHVQDGLAYRASSGAKKLTKVMTKRFGVSDYSELITST